MPTLPLTVALPLTVSPVAVTVPLTFSAPLNVVVPMATCPVQVEFAPATVPVNVGEADITTLPVPVVAVAVGTFEPLPTHTSVEANDGSDEVVSAAHVPLPARKVVLDGVPVIPDRLVVPMLVSDAPDPLNVVAVTVPLTLSAPLVVVVPMATCPVQVEFAPATVPVSVGEAASTTLPVPTKAVLHTIPVGPLAVQKSLVVKPEPVTPPPPLMDCHVPLPARNVVALGVPEALIAATGTVALVRLAPDPLNKVAVTVPLTFSAPLVVVVPMATWPVHVDDAPATVPVNVGEADSTTLPVPT